MAHQCLGCGRTFAEGSSELLRGCPGCGGTRFFYTPAPLDPEGLKGKRAEAESNLRALAEGASKDPDLWTWQKRDEWVRFDSRKMSENLSLFSSARANAVASVAAPEPPTVAEYVAAREEPAPPVAAPPPQAPAEPPEDARVSSVRVDRPGTYDIDVKALLDANPVVIEKDGVFLIHLPSVFESAEKRRD